jgi:hypothetical protein
MTAVIEERPGLACTTSLLHGDDQTLSTTSWYFALPAGMTKRSGERPHRRLWSQIWGSPDASEL